MSAFGLVEYMARTTGNNYKHVKIKISWVTPASALLIPMVLKHILNSVGD